MKVFMSAILESAKMNGKAIYLTTSGNEVPPSERKKKSGTEGSIWSQTFEENFLHEGEWITDGRVLRAGISCVPVIKTIPGYFTILNQFD